jgi:hypothetical protein
MAASGNRELRLAVAAEALKGADESEQLNAAIGGQPCHLRRDGGLATLQSPDEKLLKVLGDRVGHTDVGTGPHRFANVLDV